MLRSRCALVAIVVALLLARTAHAQSGACIAAPAAPDRVNAKIEKAIPAKGSAPLTPAVLTLTWRSTGSPPNIPAVYMVEAGSMDGAADIGQTTLPAAEPSLVMPMPNGTFYLRVRSANACGTSKASSDVRVKIEGSVEPGQPNAIVVLSTVTATRERLGKSAFVRVMGQVRNGWKAAPASFVTVTASYENDKGGGLGVAQSTIATGTAGRLAKSGVITDTALEAGGTGCFVIFAQFNSTTVSGLGLVASASTVAVQPLPEQITVDGSPAFSKNEFDDLVATGRVRNAGAAARGTEVWLEARDEAGRVLDCRGTPIDGDGRIGNGQAAAFHTVTEAPSTMARMVRWWATWTPDTAAAAEDAPYRGAVDALHTLLADPAGAAPEQIARARDAVRKAAEAVERAAMK